MAQVLVRGLETALVGRLKQRARRNGRSLEAELRAILVQARRATWRMRGPWQGDSGSAWPGASIAAAPRCWRRPPALIRVRAC
jgi:hypothetical protein